MTTATIERDRHLAEVRGAEVAERGRQVEQRLRLDDAVLQAGQHDRHAEGHDEPVQPALHDQQAVDQADRGADGEQHEDAEVGAEVGAARRRRRPARSARRRPSARGRRSTRATGPCRRSCRIRLSPTTTTPSAELCWPMPGEVRDGQERRADHRADDEQQDEDGQQRHLAQHADVHAAQPRADGTAAPNRAATGAGRVRPSPSAGRVRCSEIIAVPPRRRCQSAARGRTVMPSVATISSSRSKGGSVNSVKTSPRTRTTTRSQMTRSDSSSVHSSTPAPLSRPRSASELEQQRLRGDVHAPGRRDRDDQRRVVRQRPRDGDLLLVAAGQLLDRLGGARRHQREPGGERRRGGGPAPRPEQPEPVGQLGR